jgi:DNA invertase Pin-like site-specific DNA recombinase
MLQQMAAIAELEAGMISARTKAALEAAKRRGVVLGGYRGRSLTAKDREAGLVIRQEQAVRRAADRPNRERTTGGRRLRLCGPLQQD